MVLFYFGNDDEIIGENIPEGDYYLICIMYDDYLTIDDILYNEENIGVDIYSDDVYIYYTNDIDEVYGLLNSITVEEMIEEYPTLISFVGVLEYPNGVLDTNPTEPTTILNLGNKIVKSLSINNKTVKSIIRNSDNAILYQMPSQEQIEVNFASISLQANKTIISAKHNESAILSIQLLDENQNLVSASGVTVDFYKNNTLISTATTQNGEASITYSAAGDGMNLSFQVISNETQSNIISIDDYIFYDDALTNKSNDFTIIQGSNETYSFSHDSTGYLLTRSGQTNVFTSMLFAESNIIPFEFSTDINITQKNPSGGGYNLVFAVQDTAPSGASGYVNNNSVQIGTWSSSKFYRYYTGTTVNANTSSSGVLTSNTWFTFVISYDGSTLTMKILNTSTGTQIIGRTISNVTLNYAKYYFFFSIMCGSQSKQYFKNIKIKKI